MNSELKFPRLVYRATKDGHNGFEHHLVNEQEDYDEKLADGWHGTVPEALAAGRGAGAGHGAGGAGNAPGGGKHADDDDHPPTRAELEAKARELGISFQPNIGDKKLLQRIEIALAGAGSQ